MSQLERSAIDGRRYRITGVIGKGGFGTVYRARLESSEGFIKDVAIKLLSRDDLPPDVLTRFRDEARILGLLRDRNIVSVDPPTRLGGRWAVVMEFVDGMSCGRLLNRTGPFPVTVALELIEEIARTLDNLWHHPGEDEQPMHLLHRDLKPSNVQITPTGQVKLLDFGVARATFGQRETTTTHHIGGTVGYIAPERLDGVEDHKGDIYSLGVMLHELATGERPPRHGGQASPALDPDVRSVTELAEHMRSLEPEDRPNARQLEQTCRALRISLPGPELRDWARGNVPTQPEFPADELVGRFLSQTLSGIPRMPDEVPSDLLAPRTSTFAVFAVMGAMILVLLVVMVCGASAGTWLYMRRTPTMIMGPPSEAISTPMPADGLLAPDTPEPEVVEQAPPQPAARPAARKTAPTQPMPKPVVAPSTGTVVFTGDATSVELRTQSGAPISSPTPVGTHAVWASFGGDPIPAGSVTVPAGRAIEVRCVARFKRCMAE